MERSEESNEGLDWVLGKETQGPFDFVDGDIAAKTYGEEPVIVGEMSDWMGER